MTDALDAQAELAIAYDPPGDTQDLFGISEEALWQVVSTTLDRVKVTFPVEVSVLITNDEGLRELNRDYRAKDEPTDVLSFPQLDAPVVDAPAEELWQTDEAHHYASLLDEDMLADGDEDDIAGDEDDEDFEGDDEYEDAAGEEDADEYEDELAIHLGDIALSREAVIRQAAQAGHAPAWECAYLLAHGVLHLVGYDDHTEAGYRAMVAHQEAVLAAAGIGK